MNDRPSENASESVGAMTHDFGFDVDYDADLVDRCLMGLSGVLAEMPKSLAELVQVMDMNAHRRQLRNDLAGEPSLLPTLDEDVEMLEETVKLWTESLDAARSALQCVAELADETDALSSTVKVCAMNMVAASSAVRHATERVAQMHRLAGNLGEQRRGVGQ